MVKRRPLPAAAAAAATLAFALSNVQTAQGFQASRHYASPSLTRQLPPTSSLFMSADESEADGQPTCWNPGLRKTIGAISAAGMAETAYLTYAKLFSPGGVAALCGTDGQAGAGCGSVLEGPYASINLFGADIPLSALGFAAYTATTGLALLPLLNKSSDAIAVEEAELDSTNRIALLAATTCLITFSSFLMSILFGVLHATCPFCIASACLSATLGIISWTSDMIPPASKKTGAQAGLASFGATTAMSLALFFNAGDYAANANVDSFSSTLVASTAKVQKQTKDFPPPPVTTHSSDRALLLAADLSRLDARMFGAYWCSHCYEQKERMGLEAMQKIPYIECSKEGLNSQNGLCKDRDVPGYPTWEINGQLFPGEQELDELEDIVKSFKK
jgi:uncharacterized membrane protein